MKVYWALIFLSWISFGDPGGQSGPKCIRESTKVQDPESSARKLLEENSVEANEYFLRLVFAESLASHCLSAAYESEIIEGIAWVLRNRLEDPKKRYGISTGVVTAPRQFRSTFGTYDVSRRKEFLCPESMGEGWASHWEKVRVAWERTKSSENPMPEARNYYLTQHFRDSRLREKYHGKLPDWARKPKKQAASGCVLFF